MVRAGALRFGAVWSAGRARLGPVTAALALVLAGGACDRLPGGGPPEIELEGGRVVQLPEGTELVQVELTARGRNARFEPAEVSVRPGDVVRFSSPEGGTHALAFAAELLQPAQREFLERTNQLRAPPLLEPGAAWIVSLEGAPTGSYPFRCITHGEQGRLHVRTTGS